MAANYDDVLAQLRAAGLLVDSGLDIGRMRRTRVEGMGRERKGWYVLHELRLDNGTDVLVGGFGVWQGAENNARKIELSQDYAVTREQSAALRKRLTEDRKRADLARKAEADRAAARAAQAWRGASATGECDYLAKKGVGAHGVRFTAKGAMLVPMLDGAGKIHGLQAIRSSTQRGLAKQYWPEGLDKKGHYHQIGMPLPHGVLLVAEGYATAASLHEATGLPTAVAFDANNLQPVAEALRKRYKLAKILICADDDQPQKCRSCKAPVWLADGQDCPTCGEQHGAGNAGVGCASAAALSVGGAWAAPKFTDPAAIRAAWIDGGKKFSDFNDLHAREGLHLVRTQLEQRIAELGWNVIAPAARAAATQGGGAVTDCGIKIPEKLRPIESLDELLERFALVYGQGGTVFDRQEHMLLALSDMRDACLSRELHRAWVEHPDRNLVRVQEVGFDPAGTDPQITCNLWAGWPTQAKAGQCQHLLDLLLYMCSGESRGEALSQWVLRWLAYPLQNPGAKMKTTLVIHGPQGTGKNMFFEAIMAMYGRYGRVIDQSAIEDKFNDWASRKLFLIADEVVARSDLYHVKNKLKAFITGEWIRINPKNMAAYDERNHVNLVFLSNEAMPVVLEDDDRRHAVIWTPEKLSADFYAGLKAEIDNGGIAALHHYLLHLPMDGFTEATLPPMTDAKRELIDLSKDSPSRFWQAFERGDVDGFPGANRPALLLPALSGDLYELYRTWCAAEGLKALNQPRFANALMRKHGCSTDRKRYYNGAQTKGPATITTHPQGQQLPPGRSETEWLGERLDVFKNALRDLKNKGIV